MNEMIKKILQSDADALNSLDAFVQAAAKLGYSQEEIDEALEQVDGFPLDDDDLDEITGGFVIPHGSTNNSTKPKNPYSDRQFF